MIEQIDALLPQTHCGQCGFKGCYPYAEAIAQGTADINQCPPGGDEGIAKLAALLGVMPKPLNPRFGVHKPKQVAFIIEATCIGCVKCIAVCPVDAIVGASKQLHTVLAEECTGCELCVASCPVDCIGLSPAEPLTNTQVDAKAQRARQRYQQRNLRLQALAAAKQRRLQQQKATLKLKLAR